MTPQAPPNIHPCERLTTPTGEQADIDTEMVPLIRALWARGLSTIACCQDVGEAAEGERDPRRTTPTGHGGFVRYYRGFAWLKMPMDDTLALTNGLLGTSFHDRVSVRWQPGSWRMHVPLLHMEGTGIGLGPAAQLYFPREQLDELTTVLIDRAGGSLRLRSPFRQ